MYNCGFPGHSFSISSTPASAWSYSSPFHDDMTPASFLLNVPVFFMTSWDISGSLVIQMIRKSRQTPIAHSRTYTSANMTEQRLVQAQSMWLRFRALEHV